MFASRNYEFDGRPDAMSYVQFRLGDESVQVENRCLLEFEEKNYQENWPPFLVEKQLYAVQRINPCRILKIDMESGQSEIYSENKKINGYSKRLRGGTGLIPVGNELIGIAHTKSLPIGFLHYVYALSGNSPFKFLRNSKPFIFDDQNIRLDIPCIIEYASGMALLNESLARMTFGTWNEKAKYVDIPVSRLLQLSHEKN